MLQSYFEYRVTTGQAQFSGFEGFIIFNSSAHSEIILVLFCFWKLQRKKKKNGDSSFISHASSSIMNPLRNQSKSQYVKLENAALLAKQNNKRKNCICLISSPSTEIHTQIQIQQIQGKDALKKGKENHRRLRPLSLKSLEEPFGDEEGPPLTTSLSNSTQVLFPSSTSPISLVNLSTISLPSPSPKSFTNPKLRTVPLALPGFWKGFPYRSSGRPSSSKRSGRTSTSSEEEGEGEREALWCRRRCLDGMFGRSEEGSEFLLLRLLVSTSLSSTSSPLS